MDHQTSDRAARLALVATKALPVIVIFLGVLLLAGVYARFAPVCRLVSSLTDQPIWLEQSVFDFGHSSTGPVITETVTFRNFGDHPLEIIGAEVGCSCTAAKGVPCSLPVSSSVRLPIEIDTHKMGQFHQQVTYLVNDGGAIKRFPVIIRGEITSANN